MHDRQAEGDQRSLHVSEEVQPAFQRGPCMRPPVRTVVGRRLVTTILPVAQGSETVGHVYRRALLVPLFPDGSLARAAVTAHVECEQVEGVAQFLTRE